jgi:NitT/TauT family transport system ATP-binding protein
MSNEVKPLLTIDGLCFDFSSQTQANEKPGSQILNQVSLTVRKGEIVCILGASGCGKTTLLNLIAGLLTATKGVIELNSQKPTKRLGYIFQSDALFPWRTVKDNLLLAADIDRSLDKNALEQSMLQYLSIFHLNEQILTKYPIQLSGGMRQRVSIIQSLMFDPELLLLDEPFSALDYYTKLKLESEFSQFVKERGTAAILVTHDIEEAVAIGSRALIMNAGKLQKEFLIRSEAAVMERGSSDFAEKYREIWSELKSVVGEIQ